MKTEEKNNQKIMTCLLFDHQAEEAVQFYTSLFKNSKIGHILHYPENSPMRGGSVMSVTFFLNGQEYIALNAGPHFKFTEATSLFVKCDSQEEVDELWSKLTADGGQEGQCGWLKDKYGLSWQIVPVQWAEFVGSPDKEKASRAMQKMMGMKKLDLNELKNA